MQGATTFSVRHICKERLAINQNTVVLLHRDLMLYFLVIDQFQYSDDGSIISYEVCQQLPSCSFFMAVHPLVAKRIKGNIIHVTVLEKTSYQNIVDQ